MKKFVLGALVFLTVSGSLVYLYTFEIILFISTQMLTPKVAYEPPEESTAPDYSLEDNWVGLPWKVDGADVLADGEIDLQSTAQVDVFFLHPTTYFANDRWNDPLDGSGDEVIKKSDTLILNASVFNGSARVFAPAFRQATIGTYSTGLKTLHSVNAAFEDVLRAFDYYMENYNEGRAIFIAGHSQGSDHGLMLLHHRCSKKPLLKKLVGAYLPGRPIGREHLAEALPDIPVCSSAGQVACIVSYMTMGEGVDFSPFRNFSVKIVDGLIETYESSNSVCVNPLNWSSSEAFEEPGEGMYHWDQESNKITYREKHVEARCDHGALYIQPRFYSIVTGRSNYHAVDYPLFYKEIRKNIGLQVKNYFNR